MKYSENITAIVFDLDGTLVNTEKLKAKAHFKAIKNFGGIPSEKYYIDCIGNSFSFVFYYIKKKTALSATLKTYRKYFNEVYLKEIENVRHPIAGVMSFLKKVKTRNIKIGLVTSSDRYTMEFLITRLKLLQYFDVLVSSEDVRQQKPAPGPYLKAKRLLKTKNFIVFEDTTAGFISAHKSGAKVFGIKHNFNRKQDFSLVEKTFNDYISINLEKVLKGK